ncbi:GspH/FimT family pseudopilin [Pseudomonas oryzihabitans]|uniref:GspH/FimT family pseudopilin n=1 Tax=Pseudomonas oryzihabitans TaxID=47885 RepID=UPI002894FD1D|nr:GspH/FimT family pseudopilin [Pseudomonas oryzihabitans]MDT3718948.1 GspH/FimT family pseudopilin [Pseudomonas oryzihabitans]
MRTQYGFTLIETMVAIAILAIVISIAAPSFTRMLQSNRAAVMSNELLGALQMARSEALKRRMDVMLCRRNVAGNACENGTDWTAGWLLIQGNNVIRAWEPTTGIVLTGVNSGVTYHSNGMTSIADPQAFSVNTATCRRAISMVLTGNAFVNQNGCLSP